MFNGLGGMLGGLASTMQRPKGMPQSPQIPQGLGGMLGGYGPTFGQFNASDEDVKADMKAADDAENQRIQQELQDQLLGGGPVGSDDPTALDDIMADREKAQQYFDERQALNDGLAYGTLTREEYDARMASLEAAYAQIKD